MGIISFLDGSSDWFQNLDSTTQHSEALVLGIYRWCREDGSYLTMLSGEYGVCGANYKRDDLMSFKIGSF